MRICHLLKKEHIFLNKHPGDKKQLLEEYVSLLKKCGTIDNEEDILEALLKREGLGSTGLAEGFAVPHALIDGLEEPILALYVVKEGIDFDAADNNPTYVVLLILGSKTNPGIQLKILAHVCRMVKETDFVEQVRNSDSPSDVYDILKCDEDLIE